MNQLIENRAGKYRKLINKDALYEAFIPNNLPLIPPLKIDEKMQTLLSNADRSMGALNIVTELLPDSDFFIFSYLRKEATLSSNIEGTKGTFIDVAKAEAGAYNDEIPDDLHEIINYTKAINHGLKRIKKDNFPLTMRLLREMHGLLLSGVRGRYKTPGEFRKSQNWIGGATINTASYIPPTIPEMESALNNLELFFHDKQPMPTLIKIALIHAQFEMIHPFLDGNGRIGRVIITLLLCYYGVLDKPTLYLSEYFNIFRQEYFDRLNYVHEKGDYESWVKFFLEGVWLVAKESTETAREINALKENDLKKISGLGRKTSKNAIILLEKLFGSPVISVNDVEKITGLTFANANNLVKKLEELEILKAVDQRKRGRVFAYTKYLRLFKEKTYYKL